MHPDDIEKRFTAIDARPSEAAKNRAKAAAMEAFARSQAEPAKNSLSSNADSSQGSSSIHRLMDGDANTKRRNPMATLSHRWIYSGLASAAVLVLFVSVGSNLLIAPGTRPTVAPGPIVAESPSAVRDRVIVQKPVVRQAPALPVEAESIASQAPAVSPAKILEEVAISDDLASFSGVDAEKLADVSRVGNRALGKLTIASDYAVSTPPEGRDRFETFESGAVKLVSESPVSTFSADVDTASYSFVRKSLGRGVLPQKAAVRLEEMVNYFEYDYPAPKSKSEPFGASLSIVDSPWREGNKLLHIGIRGYEMHENAQPDSNLVFLLDVSGSMSSPDKLPLDKQSMSLLLDQLKPTDTVAIVVYAGAAGTVLEPTEVREKQKILDALRRLAAGGSTAGGEGIKRAYELARNGFKEGAVNRVILATDGDFNVGITSREELKGFIERQRESGIYLTTLGFGQGNYHDHMMQELAQNGNGVAAYIDTLAEAQKVLVDQATSMLFPIASDVKLQMEFNPATVTEYRLLGYETRALNSEDFNNDSVDAGDIGAGHRVTAIYEITPVGAASGLVDDARYRQPVPAAARHSDEYGFLKIRYKLPGENKSRLIEVPATVEGTQSTAGQGGEVLERERNFSIAVAGFAELLRGGKYSGNWQYEDVIELASANRGEDRFGYRAEFVRLARQAQTAAAMQ